MTQTVPEQQLLPPANSPSLYLEHDAIWSRISLWPVWVSSRRGVPSQLPVYLAGQASARSWKILDCLATSKNFSMLSTLFSSQIQNTALHQLAERKATLSQPKPGLRCTASFRGGLNILSPFLAIVCSYNCESCGSRPWDWDLGQCFSRIPKFPDPVQTERDRKDEDMGMPMEDLVREKESL